MSLEFNIKDNWKLKELYDKLKSPRLEKQMLSDMGLHITNDIFKRTRRGVDIDGKPFPPYSKQYKIQKGKKAHTHIVNLRGVGKTDRMMNYLKSKVGAHKVTVGFANAQKAEVAYYLQVSPKGSKKRKFMGFTKFTTAWVEIVYKKFFKMLLRP